MYRKTHAIPEYILNQKLVKISLFIINLGCVNKSFNKVWKFFEDLVEEFGVALILIGLFLTFFGAKYQKGTLFISGFMAATIVAIVILFRFNDILGLYLWCNHALIRT